MTTESCCVDELAPPMCGMLVMMVNDNFFTIAPSNPISTLRIKSFGALQQSRLQAQTHSARFVRISCCFGGVTDRIEAVPRRKADVIRAC